jgi:hypothetical protein
MMSSDKADHGDDEAKKSLDASIKQKPLCG